MNKVINGHRFNTETAKMIASRDNGLPGDLYWVSEALYRTKAGLYFIHGEGGAGSKYAKPASQGGDWTAAGEDIIPVSEDTAREFAAKNLSGDEYEVAFGSVEDGSVKISADVSAATKDKIDNIKKRTGESTGELITRLLK